MVHDRMETHPVALMNTAATELANEIVSLRRELTLFTPLSVHQCRQRLSGIANPQPVEWIGLSGKYGGVHEDWFSIHEAAQGPKSKKPHGARAEGWMVSTEVGTEILLVAGYPSWQRRARKGWAWVITLLAIYSAGRAFVTNDSIFVTTTAVFGGLAILIWVFGSAEDSLGKGQGDDHLSELIALICTTLDASVIESVPDVDSLAPVIDTSFDA